MSEQQDIQLRNARLLHALGVTALVLLLLLAFVLLLDFLGRIHTVTSILIGAVFFSYLVAPAIRFAHQRLPMWAAILVVYACIAVALFVVLWIAVPLIVSELRQFASDSPSLATRIKDDLSINGPLAAHLPSSVKAYLLTLPDQISAAVATNGLSISSSAVSILLSTASGLVLFVLVPIVTAYAVMDAQWLKGAAIGFIPVAKRPKFEEFVHAVNSVLAGYIRGQLLVAALVGTLVAALLFIFHVRYALAIGVFAGLFELVPYAGAIAGAIPGVGVALLTNGWQNALFVAIGFVAINQLSGHIFSPLIVGDQVGLRPIFVLLALLIGGELMGLRGLLIAVPVAGVIRAAIITFVPFDSSALPVPSAAPAKPKARRLFRARRAPAD
ncbi:MAG: AI-2E family transporter [Candidatus Eremiobacteraeota bacterium]|nr:AI-2E family transporter [Candidatus Eremiobacteraeota bacterium]